MTAQAYLIDDERKALAILRSKIERYCPQLEIIGQNQSPKVAILEIEELQPDLVFLDISMPEMDGFEMLKAIKNPTFEIIFVTAFDEYAIEAIRHCAIGYIVKPADKDELIGAVHKALVNIESKNALQKNKQLIANLGVQTFQKKKIVVPTQEGLEFIAIADIIRCEGTEGYTTIYLKNGQQHLSSQNIGHFVKMMTTPNFYQVHKSHLINLDYLDRYLNEGYAILAENHNVPVSRTRRAAFLDKIKETT